MGRCFLAGEIDIPFDAADAPEILALQIRARGIAVDLEHQIVLSLLEGGCDFESGQALGVLGIADFLPVHVYIGSGLDTRKIEENGPSRPSLRHREGPVIDGAGEYFRQCGRLRVSRGEIVRDIHVYRHAEPLHLPVPRYLDPVPVRALVPFHFVVIVKILEIPHAVQVRIVFAVAEIPGQRVSPVGVPDDFGPLRFGVHGGNVHILPVRQVLGRCRQRQRQGEEKGKTASVHSEMVGILTKIRKKNGK